MFQDKVLSCKDCGKEFVFSANEQEFYASKGFENEPGRCPECRSARKQQRGGMSGRRERQMYPAICSECGVETTVPFQPTGDRPIYCRDCFQSKRSN